MSAARSVALVGSTAAGKSALAHAIALERGDVEIVSVDAMGVYRGMDLATAKATAAERAEVAYHLLDLVEPSEEFSVARFQRAARDAVEGIAARGHGALLVGGTGLYHRAVIDELDLPGQYPEVREALVARARVDRDGLYDELRRRDPVAAGRLEPTNERRLIRALEVTLGSGRPFSSYGDGLTTYGPVRVVQVGIAIDDAVLDGRIATRFARWLDDGLVEEVRGLLARPGGLGRTARQAVGYKELIDHVEGGADLATCVAAAIAHSRQVARRQRSWFRRDPRVEWFDDLDAARARVHQVLDGDR